MVDTELTRRIVGLAIESDVLGIEEISKALHLQADKAVAKGNIRPGSISGIPSKRTVWELIESGDATADVTSLLQRLVARVTPVIRELKVLNDGGNQITINVILYHSPSDEGGRGFNISPAILRSIAEIGASIDVDQYVLDAE